MGGIDSNGGGILTDPSELSPSVNATVRGFVLTSTASTDVLTHTPLSTGGFLAKIAFSIMGSASVTMTATVSWTDADSGEADIWHLVAPSTSLPPGSYGCATLPFSAQADSAIIITLQASVASVVKVTASIERQV